MLSGFTGFQRIEHDARQHPIPHFLARRGLVEYVNRHDLLADSDGHAGRSIDVFQILSERRNPILMHVECVRHGGCVRINAVRNVEASDFIPDCALVRCVTSIFLD